MKHYSTITGSYSVVHNQVKYKTLNPIVLKKKREPTWYLQADKALQISAKRHVVHSKK